MYSLSTIRHRQTQMHDEIVGSSSQPGPGAPDHHAIANMRSAMRGVSLFPLIHQPVLLAKSRSSFEAESIAMRQTLQQMETSKLSTEEALAVHAIRTALDRWVQSFAEFADMCATGHSAEASDAAAKTTTPLMDALQKNTASFGPSQQRPPGRSYRRHRRCWYGIPRRRRRILTVIGMARTLKAIAESVATGAHQVAEAAAQVASSSQYSRRIFDECRIPSKKPLLPPKRSTRWPAGTPKAPGARRGSWRTPWKKFGETNRGAG